MNRNATLHNVSFWLTISLAVIALSYSIFSFPVQYLDSNLLVLTVATLFFSVFAMIQIPRIKIHITISDVLVFSALLIYGVEVATLLAVIDTAVGSLNFRRKGIEISGKTILLNCSISGISIFLTAIVVTSMFGDPKAVAKGQDFSAIAVLVCVMAGVQFMVNSVFVSIFTAIKTERSLWRVWYRYCLNGAVISITSALMAGAGVQAFYNIDSVLLVIAGIVAMLIYFTYSRYVSDVRETAEQAEFAERKRAEQAEQHIEELQHHIAQQQVTEKALRESKEKFKHAAYHDSLTNLPNRNMFTRQLQFLLKRCQQKEDARFAVLFLDLNRFKTINDSLGHSTGDNLILGVARRLSNLMRQKDMVARLSGDEFAIILNGMCDIEDVKHFAELIRKKLAAPFSLEERQVFTSVSIGIAIGDNSYETAENILRDADIAMYQSKASEKPYVVFDKRMHAHAVNLLQVETDLRYAIERDEMVAFYQPIINLKSMRLIGFEALMRWNHPTRGLVPPGEFIPVSEDTGLIVPLTMWMLRDSCQKLADWKARFPHAKDLMMSVNLSGKHFAQDDLVASVKEVLKETGIEPRCLKLELTESAIMDNAESVISILQQLKRIGVRLSIDDFGTGYSSLSYLHRFPIDALKIDRSFVSRMESGTENGEIVRTVVALAKALGLTVIAEGIETIHQLHQLRILGSEYGQGFLFSRPVPLEEALELLAEPDRWKNIMPDHRMPIVQHKASESILQLGDV
ncbi:MAG: EAL domain-containing protein [Pyrinomonadaceae bacterium]|nr:EAL domain-containing protein [Pyrinomonadaceae bacterium]